MNIINVLQQFICTFTFRKEKPAARSGGYAQEI
jgi:hypothetical protein